LEVTVGLLADAANVSREGKLNILGAFQSVATTTAPMIVPQAFLVVVVRLEIGEKGQTHTLKIRLYDADKKKLWEMIPVPFSVPQQDPRPNPEHPIIMCLQRIPIPQFGDYEFEIMLDDEPKKTVFLLVQPIVRKTPE
jgi:hypothetical protein